MAAIPNRAAGSRIQASLLPRCIQPRIRRKYTLWKLASPYHHTRTKWGHDMRAIATVAGSSCHRPLAPRWNRRRPAPASVSNAKTRMSPRGVTSGVQTSDGWDANGTAERSLAGGINRLSLADEIRHLRAIPGDESRGFAEARSLAVRSEERRGGE